MGANKSRLINRGKNLAIRAAIVGVALSSGLSCGGRQTQPAAAAEQAAAPAEQARPQFIEMCKKGKGKVRECLIENIFSECATREQEPTQMRDCITEGLFREDLLPQWKSEHVSVVVSPGEEVMWTFERYGHTVKEFQVVLSGADKDGAEVSLSIDSSPMENMKSKTNVSKETLRLNFDGTLDGTNFLLRRHYMHVDDFRVERAEGGKVRVNFEKLDPRPLMQAIPTTRARTSTITTTVRFGKPREKVRIEAIPSTRTQTTVIPTTVPAEQPAEKPK